MVSRYTGLRFSLLFLVIHRTRCHLLTRQMVAGLTEELREIRQRVNGLIFITVAAVIADVVVRLTH